MKQITKYVKRNGKMLGCLVGIGYDEYGGYAIGWSKYHNGAEDKPFSKKKALEIATGRALNDSPMIDEWLLPNFPDSFSMEIEEFIGRCKRYFKDVHGPRNWAV